jgi:hypothetical protein
MNRQPLLIGSAVLFFFTVIFFFKFQDVIAAVFICGSWILLMIAWAIKD